MKNHWVIIPRYASFSDDMYVIRSCPPFVEWCVYPYDLETRAYDREAPVVTSQDGEVIARTLVTLRNASNEDKPFILMLPVLPSTDEDWENIGALRTTLADSECLAIPFRVSQPNHLFGLAEALTRAIHESIPGKDEAAGLRDYDFYNHDYAGLREALRKMAGL